VGRPWVEADLQIHSDLGDGLSSIEEISTPQSAFELDVIALTDHDDIRARSPFASSTAQRLEPGGRRPRVEVTTRSGHSSRSGSRRRSRCFCSSSPRSPDSRGRRRRDRAPPALVPDVSIGEGALRQLAALGDGARMVDAIELRIPRTRGACGASRAAWLNTHVLRLAETGSSDAHHAALVGTCWTTSPEHARELRAALRGHATTADGRGWTLREHLDGAATQQWRSMVRDPIKRARRRIRSRAVRRRNDRATSGCVGMKIGIVSPYAYPRPGGANSYIRESYTELRRPATTSGSSRRPGAMTHQRRT